MSGAINIYETREDPNTWFNLKSFKIGNVSFDKPEKSLDLNCISTRDEYVKAKLNYDFKICESKKLVHSFSEIENKFYNERSYDKFFLKKGWSVDIPNVLNLTLGFNPLGHEKNLSIIDAMLTCYYSYSNLFLTIPNIKLTKTVRYPSDTEPYSQNVTVPVIEIDSYLKFVEHAFSILNEKNHKKIFVPVPMKASISQIDRLLDFYIKKEYFNYWFDFEGMSVGSGTLSRIRYFFSRLSARKRFGDAVSYFTNVCRELDLNYKRDYSAASDVLNTIAGANIVGIDEDRNVYGETFKYVDKPDIPKDYKAREFIPYSYYYVRTTNKDLVNRAAYTSHNAGRLAREFETQKGYFEDEGTVVNLLSKKEMLNKYENGLMMKELREKIPSDFDSSASLLDFLTP